MHTLGDNFRRHRSNIILRARLPEHDMLKSAREKEWITSGGLVKCNSHISRNATKHVSRYQFRVHQLKAREHDGWHLDGQVAELNRRLSLLPRGHSEDEKQSEGAIPPHETGKGGQRGGIRQVRVIDGHHQRCLSRGLETQFAERSRYRVDVSHGLRRVQGCRASPH
jgi:hypothetical protein